MLWWWGQNKVIIFSIFFYLKKTQPLVLRKSQALLETVFVSKKSFLTHFQSDPAPSLLDPTSGEEEKGRKEYTSSPNCLSLWVLFFCSLRGFVFDLKKQNRFQGKLILLWFKTISFVILFPLLSFQLSQLL